MSELALPDRLYKYRPFNVNTLKMIAEQKVYYADPRTFNDPLDCQPEIDIKDNYKELECLVDFLLMRHSEMRLGWTRSVQQLRGILRSRAGDLNIASEDRVEYVKILVGDVKEYLFQTFGGFGVCSLAERFDCPLMWSHYADHHRGLCIGYDLTNEELAFEELRRVSCRRRSPSIKINELMNCVKENDLDGVAHKKIKDKYFLSKAPQWYYEKEWRDVMKDGIGSRNAPARIAEVYFGLKCDESVVKAIVRIHATEMSSPNFYRVFRQMNGFALGAKLMDQDEISSL
jgi:hypothetical protein